MEIRLMFPTVVLFCTINYAVSIKDEDDVKETKLALAELENALIRRHKLLSGVTLAPPDGRIQDQNPDESKESGENEGRNKNRVFGPPGRLPTERELISLPAGPPAIRPFSELETEEQFQVFREEMRRLALQKRRHRVLSDRVNFTI